MDAYHLKVIHSISEVDAVEWNKVIADTVFLSHEVFEFAETNALHSDKARYFLLYDENESLQAISIALIINKHSEFGIEGSMFGRLFERLYFFKHFLRPALICGFVGHGAPVYARPGKNQSEWVSRMVDEMEIYAHEHRGSIGFSRLLSDQNALSCELKRRGYCHAYGLPEAKINIKWKDTESYLKTLKTIKRKYYENVRREMNRFQRSGISIHEWNGKDSQLITSLLDEHFNERNRIKASITPESLSALKFKLKNCCKIYLANKGEKLIGVLILLKKGDAGRAWRIGVDHSAEDNSFTYFNLGYYFLLAKAAEWNLKYIWFGSGVLSAKLRRGCSVEITEFYYQPRRVIWKPIYSFLFLIQRAWYKHKFKPLMNSNANA